MSIPLYIVIIVILVILSAFFSGAETIFFSCNKIKLKSLASNGNRKAKRVLNLIDKPDKLISAILIGNNICNITATTIAGVMFLKIISNNQGLASTVSTIVMTVIMLVLGEITPKTVFQKNPDGAAMVLVDVMRFFYTIFIPFTWFFGLWQKLLEKMFRTKADTSITDDELKTFVEEAETGGTINEYESDLIRSAIEFDDQKVKEIFTPRVDVDALELGTDMETALQMYRESGHSRLPVYEESIDNIVGVLNVKDFYTAYLNGEKTIDSAINRHVIFVAPSMKISVLMRTLQKDKNHLAVVVDEFGGTHGIVTLEDILEELVGEIWDEHDEVVEYFKKLDENKYEVDCSVSYTDFVDYFELKADEEEDVTQLSGLLANLLGRLPQCGDTVEYKNLKITVTYCEHMKAEKCEVEVLPVVEEEDEEENKLFKF